MGCPARAGQGSWQDIDWKSPHAALEAVGVRAKVVNARQVKKVSGRKTDVGDAHWLATLQGNRMNAIIILGRFRKLRFILKLVVPAQAGTQFVLRKPGFRHTPE